MQVMADGSNRTLQLESMVGTVVPTTGEDLFAAVHEGFLRVSPEGLCAAAPFTPPAHDPAKARFNDGKCDSQDRFWAGTMALDGSGSADALYSLEPGGGVRKRLSSGASRTG